MAAFLLLLFLLSAATGLLADSRPCCSGEDNRMVKKRCAGGEPFDALTCPSKYVMPKERTLKVDVDDHLLIAESRIAPDEYCATRINDSQVYIVCFGEQKREVMPLVNAIFELVSVFFLLLTVAVYVQVPQLLDLQGICILHLLLGLIVSFVVLASLELMPRSIENTLCMCFAYALYFSILYAFFWLNMLSFHIWRTVAMPRIQRSQKYWALVYHIIGVGGPIGLSIILVIASSMQYSDMHPGLGRTKCWFQSTKTQFIYFYAPMALLLCSNIVYYVWTITILCRNLAKCDEKKANILRYRLILSVKLFFIMGITWIFEVISAALQDVPAVLEIVWYATDIVNTLQGLLIFLILVVFRKRVIKGLANRSFCGILRLPSRWRNLEDDECEVTPEEFGLSEVQQPPKN